MLCVMLSNMLQFVQSVSYEEKAQMSTPVLGVPLQSLFYF